MSAATDCTSRLITMVTRMIALMDAFGLTASARSCQEELNQIKQEMNDGR